MEPARKRRSTSRRDADLAQGPARLAVALGVDRTQDGEDVVDGPVFRLLPGTPPPAGLIRTGPRTGISTAREAQWRFWIEGDPTVSPYRAHSRAAGQPVKPGSANRVGSGSLDSSTRTAPAVRPDQGEA